MSTTTRAPFIVIEGLDRSGKTTQTALLESWLQQRLPDKPVRLLKFPDRTTPIGQMIDSYLKSNSELDDHVIHLLFSANRWELASTIKSLLNSGTTVLCDRYAFSGIAFSASKVLPPAPSTSSSATQTPSSPSPSSSTTTTHPPTPKLPFAWCRAPDVGLPSPDLTLFLDISPHAAKARGGYGEERYEKEEMQARVREVFKRIASEEEEEGGERDDIGEGGESGKGKQKWRVVDAGRDVDTVADELWDAVYPLVANGVSAPLGRLWTDKL